MSKMGKFLLTHCGFAASGRMYIPDNITAWIDQVETDYFERLRNMSKEAL
jgi:hypothetical protein